jgi:hypothetical protein
MDSGPTAKAVTSLKRGGQIDVLGTFAGRRMAEASPSEL